MCHLILATDNETGSRIMRSIYDRAASEHEAIRREAAERRRIRRDEDRGRPSLFGAGEIAAGSPGDVAPYVHEAPWRPYPMGGETAAFLVRATPAADA